jgi:magnesium transporter
MMDAFASVISNNLNMVMKFLTSVTIILALPTMVASFFGMNVNLPYQNHPYAFVMILIVVFLLSSFTALIFWKKKFF